MRFLTLALALGLTPLAGCVSADAVTPRGTVPGGWVPVAGGGAYLTADEGGAVQISREAAAQTAKDGEETPILRLPTASERDRYGVTLADISALPPTWRPAHAGEGTVIVSALRAASPLAIAGLRPFDVVLLVDGKRPTRPEDVVRRLREPDGVFLEVVRAEGNLAPTRHTIKARAEHRLSEETEVHIPFVLHSRSATTGSALAIGPIDAIFSYRSALDPKRGYRRVTKWGAALNLVNWGHGKLRILWFIPIYSGREE